MSLDRHGEVPTPQGRYDLSLGSDKSSSLSRSETGTYDVIHAEFQQPKHTLNVNNNRNLTGETHESEIETKKKKWPSSKAYFLAKELLTTERTYKRDLEILNRYFREEVFKTHFESLQTLFELLDSLSREQCGFLRDVEHRMVLWESAGSVDNQRIGDILMKNIATLPIYDEYIQSHYEILLSMNEMFEGDDEFRNIYREFELKKVCYLPITELILKPLQRVSHYQLILERLLEFYSEDHIDYGDCRAVYDILRRTTSKINTCMEETQNFVQLCELQRDISGFDKLIQNQRRFIRQGCLLKHSKRGLQQRMFFLFSDILLYGMKSPQDLSFRILGHVPIRSLLTENAEYNTFSIYGGQCAITVSAGTTAEKTLWLAELSKAAMDIKCKPHVQYSLSLLKSCTSSEEGLDSNSVSNGNRHNNLQQGKTLQQKANPSSRSNTALHVCWHRGATVSLEDHIKSNENQLSGYLLRKFKNSSGWQKLWVVHTSFCLYFYKSYQDEFALASLPLLGYSVGPPGHQDIIQKDFVFKLTFKNHVYFFRAESIHTYNRWLEVLRSTTQTQNFKNIPVTST